MQESGEKRPIPSIPSSGSQPKPRAVAISLGQRERRIIFREMIKAEIEAGLLRYSKRRQLMRYASKLGIPRLEASLMIARVQHKDDGLKESRHLSTQQVSEKIEAARRYSQTMRTILLVTVVYLAFNVLVFTWLL